MGQGRKSQRRQGRLGRLGALTGAGLLAATLGASLPAQVATPQSAFVGVPLVQGAPVLSHPHFEYPREAFAHGVAGIVVVAVLVGEDGVPVRHRIVRADPPLIFDAVVNAAIPEFRFATATQNGRPARYETQLTLSFDPQAGGTK